MRSHLTSLLWLALSACGSPPSEETPREPHGGEQQKDGSGSNATIACVKPQLELTGKTFGFAYERTVKCSEVQSALLEQLSEHNTFTITKTVDGEALAVMLVTFEERFQTSKYTGPANVVVRYPGDAVVGNCPGEFPSTVSVEDLVTGSLTFKNLRYLKDDGTCGGSVEGEVSARWTTKP